MPIEYIFIDIFIYIFIKPFLRTYHLIEMAILLAFYMKETEINNCNFSFCVIPDALLEIGTEMLGNGYTLQLVYIPFGVFDLYLQIN